MGASAVCLLSPGQPLCQTVGPSQGTGAFPGAISGSQQSALVIQPAVEWQPGRLAGAAGSGPSAVPPRCYALPGSAGLLEAVPVCLSLLKYAARLDMGPQGG